MRRHRDPKNRSEVRQKQANLHAIGTITSPLCTLCGLIALATIERNPTKNLASLKARLAPIPKFRHKPTDFERSIFGSSDVKRDDYGRR